MRVIQARLLLAILLVVTGPATAAALEITYATPLTITLGGIYEGNWESRDPDVPAVRILTTEPVVIDGANIRGAGNLIEAEEVPGARLTVRNTKGQGIDPAIAGRTKDRFIAAAEPAQLIVENNLISSTGGIYVLGLAGGGANETIRIRFNRFRNIDGRVSKGNGLDMSDNEGVALVQAVQLDKVRNAQKVEIAWNEIINEPFESRVEDNINIYRSSGTAAKPISIHDNYIQGAYPTDPVRDAYSGGGIMVDDSSAHVRIHANQVVATTNHGIAIAGGHDNTVEGNTVVGSGILPDGSRIAAQNVGIYVWNAYGNARFEKNLVKNNRIAWANRQGGRNDTWFHDCPPGDCRDNQALPHPVTLASEREQAAMWREKLAGAGITLGIRAATAARPQPEDPPESSPGSPHAATDAPGSGLERTGRATRFLTWPGRPANQMLAPFRRR